VRKGRQIMKRLILKPDGWECILEECPAGFFVFNNAVCFKSEYRTENGIMEVFCESGEYFCGGTSDEETKGNLTVQPVIAEWEYEE